MLLLIAWRHFIWWWSDEGRCVEDPGVGLWAAASFVYWFIGWRRGRRRVLSAMCWLIEGAWEGVICGGIPQINWARGRFMVLELHNERGGSDEDWWRGRKAGARGLSDINEEVRWWLVVVLPIAETEERCFELYTLDVCHPKRLFPTYRTLV